MSYRLLTGFTVAILLVGCLPPGGGDDDDDGGGDDGPEPLLTLFEPACADTWPADECGAGNCYESDIEQRFGETWTPWFQDRMGYSDQDMAQHVSLRRVETYEAQQSSGTDIYFQLDIDWVRLVFFQYAQPEGGDPTEEEIAAEFDTYSVPDADLDAVLVPYTEVEAFLADCEATHGVDFDEPQDDWPQSTPWCEPWVPQAGDDDGPGIRYNFFYFIGGLDCVMASIDVTGNEAPRCDVVTCISP